MMLPETCRLSMPLPLLEGCRLEYKKESKASCKTPAECQIPMYYHTRGEAKGSRQTKATTLFLCACRGVHCLRLQTISARKKSSELTEKTGSLETVRPDSHEPRALSAEAIGCTSYRLRNVRISGVSFYVQLQARDAEQLSTAARKGGCCRP